MIPAHELTERVLSAVELIPPGSVATYGDIAELVGTGPRMVGRIMAHSFDSVPWWRVVNASGKLPEHLLAAAKERWAAEGITQGTGGACRLRSHRADLLRLAAAWQAIS